MQPSTLSMILPLDSESADLALVGGKGANLTRLARAGFPVPGGFLITVEAYRQSIRRGNLASAIRDRLASGNLSDPQALERISSEIRAFFTPERIDPALGEAILAAYIQISSPAVAVRSSATAEDLPEMSFAGQQDTYLNIRGEAAPLKAVANCWGSLWTARAIGYRHRQGVPQEEIALAVVVQQMVQSESSGVMFTANPLTGLRAQTVIDATLGLGEALVSGQVEPDHYTVEPLEGRIIEKTLGAKALSIRGQASGGVETVREDAATRQALPDEQILALARLGQQAAQVFDTPQDIEWAWAGNALYLLQSRPITSLYPIPEGTGPQDLRVFFSFGAVQGMLDPMTHLGQEMFRQIFVGGAALFGVKIVDEEKQAVLRRAGERLWVDITGMLRNPVSRKIVRSALRAVEPSIGQNLELVWNDPRLVPTEKHIQPRTVLRLARFFVPMAGRVLRNWAQPEKRMALFRQQVEERVEIFHQQVEMVQGTPGEKLARRAYLLRSLRYFVSYLSHNLISALMAGMSQFYMLNTLAGEMDEELGTGTKYKILVLEVTRGIPFNVTTEMDLALWQAARAIQADPASLALFQALDQHGLVTAYRARQMPAPALQAVDGFLQAYGLRGVAEIDMGRPRWQEDPTQVLEVIGSYLQIENPDQSPDAVFHRGARSALEAVEKLVEAAHRTKGGWLKARRIRFAARRIRALIGAREGPKFFAVRVSGLVRLGILQSGQEYAALGLIRQPEDLFHLSLGELEAFARGEPGDWQSLIDARRVVYEREKTRRQIPRLLLSDGRAFYEGISAKPNAAEGALVGAPVSPGLCEGLVRIVFDPREAQLVPGEILVCPGTDPAWTPLFLAAGGLVMEVGGMMTHGAVVAREYGIPAVVGVHNATTRLQTGQRIRVNGSTGEIVILE